MHAERIDRLSKLLAAAETRRGVARLLVALPLGLTLVSRLGDGPDVTAEDDDHGSSHRHHRRKARNSHDPGRDKQPGGKQARFPYFLKSISVRVHNPGPNAVTFQYSYFREGFVYLYCTTIDRVSIPPGQSLTFRSAKPDLQLWINDRYWFAFTNREGLKPIVAGAVDGTSLTSKFRGCPPIGTTVLHTQLGEHRSVSTAMDGAVFSVTRHRDSKYKEFTLMLPGI
jgi:hypothetical protein